MLEHLGIKSSTAVAGFFGGVAALSYLQPSSVWHALSVLVCGLAGAVYWTPVAVHYFALEGGLEHAAAFTIGLASMGIIGAVLGLVEKAKNNPMGLLDAWRGRR